MIPAKIRPKKEGVNGLKQAHFAMKWHLEACFGNV
jgi:hypothetical protein